jgi:hypothetical protein
MALRDGIRKLAATSEKRELIDLSERLRVAFGLGMLQAEDLDNLDFQIDECLERAEFWRALRDVGAALKKVPASTFEEAMNSPRPRSPRVKGGGGVRKAGARNI